MSEKNLSEQNQTEDLETGLFTQDTVNNIKSKLSAALEDVVTEAPEDAAPEFAEPSMLKPKKEKNRAAKPEVNRGDDTRKDVAAALKTVVPDKPDENVHRRTAGRAEIVSHEVTEEPEGTSEPAHTRRTDRRRQASKGKLPLIIALVVIVVVGFAGLWHHFLKPWLQYREAFRLEQSMQYDAAIQTYTDLADYRDCTERILVCNYLKAENQLANKQYEEARAGFMALGTYEDSAQRVYECDYGMAAQLLDAGDFDGARKIFLALGDYNDSAQRAREALYLKACQLDEQAEYAAAQEIYTQLEGYQDSSERAVEARYQEIQQVLAQGNTYEGFSMLLEMGDTHNARAEAYGLTGADLSRAKALAASTQHVAVLRKDGTVFATGDNRYGQCDVNEWRDIVSVAVGDLHTLGLKLDGTVVAVGSNAQGQCEVSQWKNIKAIIAGTYMSIGITYDDEIVYTSTEAYAPFDFTGWTKIKDISVGYDHVVALTLDGRLLSCGDNYSKQIEGTDEITGVKAVYAGKFRTVLLMQDGTIRILGADGGFADASAGWKDIQDVSFTLGHLVALKTDGTLLAAGADDRGQCRVSEFENIAQACTTGQYVIGLKKDGTVQLTGGQALNWSDIRVWD